MSELPKNWIELIYLLAPAFCAAATTVGIAFMIASDVDTEWFYPLGAGASTLTAQLLARKVGQ